MTEQQILPTRYHHGKPLPSIRGGMIAADAEELVAEEPDVPSEDVQPGGDMAVRGVGREEGAAAMTADSTNTAGVLAFWVGLAVFACLFYLLCAPCGVPAAQLPGPPLHARLHPATQTTAGPQHPGVLRAARTTPSCGGMHPLENMSWTADGLYRCSACAQ